MSSSRIRSSSTTVSPSYGDHIGLVGGHVVVVVAPRALATHACGHDQGADRLAHGDPRWLEAARAGHGELGLERAPNDHVRSALRERAASSSPSGPAGPTSVPSSAPRIQAARTGNRKAFARSVEIASSYGKLVLFRPHGEPTKMMHRPGECKPGERGAAGLTHRLPTVLFRIRNIASEPP